MTLFLVLVIGLVGRAVMLLGPGALSLTDNSNDRLRAQRAAESGLQYATAKLRENPSWKGNDNRVTVDLPGMYVVEDNGNVVGLLSEKSGQVSQFRLRFNYQDGDPGSDELPDPDSQLQIDNIFVSLNNLESDIEVPVPRAESGSWEVADSAQGPYELPGGMACLLVEGRSGRGLGGHTKQAPNASLAGPVRTHVAEAYLQVALADPVGEASMMGGGDILFDLVNGGKAEVKADGRGREATPRLRSKGTVTVRSAGMPAELEMENGEVSRDQIFDALVDGSIAEVQENVGDGKDFFNLKWDDVAKADSDPNTTSAVQIPAGTYVNWDNGTIHYFDMSLNDYKAHAQANPADPGVVLSPDLREVRQPTNLTNNPTGIQVEGDYSSYSNRWRTRWTIEKDLAIQASPSGVADFSVIPRSGAAYSAGDASDVIASSDDYDVEDIRFEIENAVLSNDGDIRLYSELKGENATLTTAKNLRLITSETKLKVEKKDEDKGDKEKGGLGLGLGTKKLQLNMYVKNDISISTYEGKGKFNDLKLEGLVYSWGDFYAKLADSGQQGRAGKFELKGALVAYGADPVTESPGSGGKGKITVEGKEVKIEWDDREMADVMDLGSSSVTLRRTLYNVNP